MKRKAQYLTGIEHIVAIGGGHGLGRVMSALSFMQERLTGIVTTTDNGGSSGRIRNDLGGIAWGDLRNCINQIITKPTTASAVFEYRFSGHSELAGHSLGNLIFTALENMHIRPTEAVNLIRNFLRIKSFIIPMSDIPVDLAAILPDGRHIIGEVNIDALSTPPAGLYPAPVVPATPEAVIALQQAQVILLGPGSFFTSIMPPLLLAEIIEALRQSRAKKIFIDNLGTEHSAAAALSLPERIKWIENSIGKPIIDGIITSSAFIPHAELKDIRVIARDLHADDVSYRHDRELLCRAIDDLINDLEEVD
ncbi:putative cofD-like protein [Mesocricetibacter intestinalis]|uniref:Putative gluconeogenesis factor n=1 Tax=Mesocricetibacter intestinalis TaxID=1521930 RepID=A0A4R6VEV3_9PAST|nr:uridine diphosphate-N-acetylglucosamine-binding protein YvcK [Mesocricetibacter intestinalis]TDQ59058.1 putative cofD-like protein [Mesocricetibacter intestinalis]